MVSPDLAPDLANPHWWQALFFPIGSTIASWITIRAGILGRMRGGIYWRGTFYSNAALRKGRRFSY